MNTMPAPTTIGGLVSQLNETTCYAKHFTVVFPKSGSAGGCPGAVRPCNPSMSCDQAKNRIIAAMDEAFTTGATTTSGRGQWRDPEHRTIAGEDVWVISSSHSCTERKKLRKMNQAILRAMHGTCQKFAYYKENNKGYFVTVTDPDKPRVALIPPRFF